MKKFLVAFVCFLFISSTCEAIDYVVSVRTDKDCSESYDHDDVGAFDGTIRFNVSPFNQGPFNFSITYTLTDENGTVYATWTDNYGGLPSGSPSFSLPDGAMDGLDSGSYLVTASITVNKTNGAGGTSTLAFNNKGGSICGAQSFANQSSITCNLGTVGCFDYEAECFSIGMYEKLGQIRTKITGGSGSYAYSWVIYPSGQIFNATSVSGPDRVPTRCGKWVYRVTVTDLVTGCEESAWIEFRKFCYEIELDPKGEDEIGIKSNNKGNRFIEYNSSIYPNPAINLLNVELAGNVVDDIELYDMTGRLVKSIQTNQSEGVLQIDVSDLNTGVYMMIFDGGQNESLPTKKISILK